RVTSSRPGPPGSIRIPTEGVGVWGWSTSQDPESWASCVVYAVHDRRIERVADRLFEGEEAVLHVIERIVAPLGLRVDATSPWVDARLPDGSRVHAIVPPLSLCGPVLNVRKFSSIPLGPGDLLARGTIGPRMLAFLAACVRGRMNIAISGGTSSGKTTLLAVLS